MGDEGYKPSERLRFVEKDEKAEDVTDSTSGQVVSKSKKKKKPIRRPVRGKGRKKPGGNKAPPPGGKAPGTQPGKSSGTPSKLKKDPERPKGRKLRQEGDKARPSDRLRDKSASKPSAKFITKKPGGKKPVKKKRKISSAGQAAPSYAETVTGTAAAVTADPVKNTAAVITAPAVVPANNAPTEIMALAGIPPVNTPPDIAAAADAAEVNAVTVDIPPEITGTPDAAIPPAADISANTAVTSETNIHDIPAGSGADISKNKRAAKQKFIMDKISAGDAQAGGAGKDGKSPETSGQVVPKLKAAETPPEAAASKKASDADIPPATAADSGADISKPASPRTKEDAADPAEADPGDDPLDDGAGTAVISPDADPPADTDAPGKPANDTTPGADVPGGDKPPPDGGKKPPPDPKAKKKAAKDDKKLGKSGRRADKTGAKLEKAQDKLAKQKSPKKPNIGTHIGNAAKYEAWRYVHGKIHEVERENVGIEAAHRAELAGEGLGRSGSRFIKNRNRTRPARRVRKRTKKDIKAKSDFQFRTLKKEHPEMVKKNPVSRHMQKQRIKKQYQKKAREAAKKTAKKTGEKAASATQKVGKAIIGYVKKHPAVLLIALGIFLLLITVQSCMSVFVSMGNSAMGAIAGTAYLAEDTDIDKAGLAWSEWETDLRLEIANTETARPGYDEYRYSVGATGHDPLELMAYLTAMYDDFTYSGVEGELRGIFDAQYNLSVTESVEIRYRIEIQTVTHTDPDTGEEYDEDVEVEVPYDWYILTTVLTSKDFYYEVAIPCMNGEQYMRYQVYMVTRGLRAYTGNPFDFDWVPNIINHYGWRVHPATGAKDQHMGIDISVPVGTSIKAGHGGKVTFAGNTADYGLVVTVNDGKGLVTKYAHCSVISVTNGQTVKAGDVIAKSGGASSAEGPHLHMEVIKDGNYRNPVFFAVSNDE